MLIFVYFICFEFTRTFLHFHQQSSQETKQIVSRSALSCYYYSMLSSCPGQTRKHCCVKICDSRCFLKCFHVCPPVETLLRKQNLLPGKQKCFLAKSETFDVSLCISLMFSCVCPLQGNMAKHW